MPLSPKDARHCCFMIYSQAAAPGAAQAAVPSTPAGEFLPLGLPREPLLHYLIAQQSVKDLAPSQASTRSSKRQRLAPTSSNSQAFLASNGITATQQSTSNSQQVTTAAAVMMADAAVGLT